MAIKTLNQLRQESKIHTDKAMQLFNEASKIVESMRNAQNLEENLRLRKEWLKKDAEAREELEKSLEAYNRFVNQLARYKTCGLN